MRATLKTHSRLATPVGQQNVTAESLTESAFILEVLQQKHVTVHTLAILKYKLGRFLSSYLNLIPFKSGLDLQNVA